MTKTLVFKPGGYRFIKAVFQYSGGVVAMPGYRIVRVRFAKPIPLYEGFQRIKQTLRAAGRPVRTENLNPRIMVMKSAKDCV